MVNLIWSEAEKLNQYKFKWLPTKSLIWKSFSSLHKSNSIVQPSVSWSLLCGFQFETFLGSNKSVESFFFGSLIILHHVWKLFFVIVAWPSNIVANIYFGDIQITYSHPVLWEEKLRWIFISYVDLVHQHSPHIFLIDETAIERGDSYCHGRGKEIWPSPLRHRLSF